MRSKFLFFVVVCFSFSLILAAEKGKDKKEFRETGKIINSVYETNKMLSPSGQEPTIDKEEEEELQRKQEKVNRFYESFNRDKDTNRLKMEQEKPVQRKSRIKPKKTTTKKKGKPQKATKKRISTTDWGQTKRLSDEDLLDIEPYGPIEFSFANFTFERSGVYVVYTKKMLYFTIGGRVYGPKLLKKKKGLINRWMSPLDFADYAEDEDFMAYKVGELTPSQIKRFHIFWLANYNNKLFSEISTNSCFYTDILNKLNNYQVKYYVMEQDKRNYFDVRKIIKEKDSLLPPIEQEFEGEFEDDDSGWF